MLEVELPLPYLTFTLPFSYSQRCFNVVQCLFLLGTLLQPKECIVCQARKTAASSSGYQDLVKCLNNTGSSSLISFSEGCLNKYIQAQLTGLRFEEIKAKEFCYHRSYQRDITREHGSINKEKVNSRKKCFNKLVQHVRYTLIENQQFSTVSKLSALYAKFQVERNISVKGVLHKNVKRS